MIQTQIHPNDVFDPEGAIDRLKVKKSTIAREVALGRLKCYRRGRVTYFLGSDILDWIRAGEVKPTQVDIEEEETPEV